MLSKQGETTLLAVLRSSAKPLSFTRAPVLKLSRLRQRNLHPHIFGISRKGPCHVSAYTTDANSRSSTPSQKGEESSAAPGEVESQDGVEGEEELGAMSQRLQGLAEESDVLNPRAALRRMQQEEKARLGPDATNGETGVSEGLSEALKNDLLERIKGADFEAENAAAISYSKLPSHASKHTRDIAMSQAWTGTESTYDVSLRMLTDAHKLLRGKQVAPTSRSPVKHQRVGGPVNNTLRSGPKVSVTQRIMRAKDQAEKYNLIKKPEDQLTQEERAEVKRLLKERFSPSARAVPATIEGLAALANEKIEDAFARGVFKDLPNAGKPMERDHHANSPFIDNTTYLLNRAIQRQEITLPWIDKQKTLLREAAAFRSRLRATWKRHVMRSVASSGGGVEDWIKKASEFEEAEKIINPDPALPLKKKEEIEERKWRMDGRVTQIGERIPAPAPPELPKEPQRPSPASSETAPTIITDDPVVSKDIRPFRDATWLATESGYHKLAVKTLNDMVTSYNLECPRVAQKVYYNLDFELRACYRQVAKEVVIEFRERASNPDFGKYLAGDDIDGSGPRSQSGQGEFLKTVTTGFGEKTLIFEEKKEKSYGFKEFLRDLFSKPANP